MDKEKIKLYSQRYKKVQKRLAISVSIFIYIVGSAIIAGAIALLIINSQQYGFIIAIMGIAAVADIFLGVKFLKYSLTNLKYMKPVDAAMRYSKITGNSLEEEKKDSK